MRVRVGSARASPGLALGGRIQLERGHRCRCIVVDVHIVLLVSPIHGTEPTLETLSLIHM